VTVDADAAVDAVENLIRNSWTCSDIFVIEEVREPSEWIDSSPLSGKTAAIAAPISDRFRES
jgi:hypothetical protein